MKHKRFGIEYDSIDEFIKQFEDIILGRVENDFKEEDKDKHKEKKKYLNFTTEKEYLDYLSNFNTETFNTFNNKPKYKIEEGEIQHKGLDMFYFEDDELSKFTINLPIDRKYDGFIRLPLNNIIEDSIRIGLNSNKTTIKILTTKRISNVYNKKYSVFKRDDTLNYISFDRLENLLGTYDSDYFEEMSTLTFSDPLEYINTSKDNGYLNIFYKFNDNSPEEDFKFESLDKFKK